MNIEKYINNISKKIDKPLVVFDLETTEVSTETAEIIEICAIKINPDGKSTKLELTFKPSKPIPKQSSEVHGFYDEDVAHLGPFKKDAHKIAEFMSGAYVTGFNTKKYDIPILVRQLKESGIENVEMDGCFDTLVLYHQEATRKLEDALMYYTGEKPEDSHIASSDVDSTIAVLSSQLDKHKMDYKSLSEKTLKTAEEKKKKFNNGLPRGVSQNEKSFCLTFGKYKQTPIEKVPKDYLQWIVNGSDLSQDLKDWIEKKFKNELAKV